MPIRIAVTGGQGSGKTTLARAITLHFPSRAVLLDGVSQKVAARGLPLGEAASIDTILAFAYEHLARERSAPEADILVFDRCLLDLLAYAVVLNLSTELIELVEELASSSLHRMTAVFYVPIGAQNVAKASAHETTTFRHRVAAEVRAAAVRLQLPLLELPEIHDERLPALIEKVRTLLNAAWH